MKKLISILVAAALLVQGAVMLSACGADGQEEEKGTIAMETTKAKSTVAPTTRSTTAQPTTAAPTTVAPTTVAPATFAPATQKPTEETQQQPQNNVSSYNNNQPNNNAPQNNQAQNNAPAQGSFSDSDVNFSYNGTSVALGEDINSVISKIGSTGNVYSAPSCHGDGEDKTFEYNGFSINTCPSGGKDMVLEITVTSPGIATAKGVKVGDSASQVVAAYGSGYREQGSYLTYTSGSRLLQFFMDNGIVSEIDYYYDI